MPLNAVADIAAFVEAEGLTATAVQSALDGAYRSTARVDLAMGSPEGLNPVDVLAIALHDNFADDARRSEITAVLSGAATEREGSLAELGKYITPDQFLGMLQQSYAGMSFYGLDRLEPEQYFQIFADAIYRNWGGVNGMTGLFHKIIEKVGYENHDSIAEILEGQYPELSLPRVSSTAGPVPPRVSDPGALRPSVALVVYNALSSDRDRFDVTAIPEDALASASRMLDVLDYDASVRREGNSRELVVTEKGARADTTRQTLVSEIVSTIVEAGGDSGRESFQPTSKYPEPIVKEAIEILRRDYEFRCTYQEEWDRDGQMWLIDYREIGGRAASRLAQQTENIVDRIVAAHAAGKSSESLYPTTDYPEKALREAKRVLRSVHELAISWDTTKGHSGTFRNVQIRESGDRATQTTSRLAQGIVQEVLQAVGQGESSVSIYPLSRCPDNALAEAKRTLRVDYNLNIRWDRIKGHSGTFQNIRITETGERKAATEQRQVEAIVDEIREAHRTGSSSISVGAGEYASDIRARAKKSAQQELGIGRIQESPFTTLGGGNRISLSWKSQQAQPSSSRRPVFDDPIEQAVADLNVQNAARFNVEYIESYAVVQAAARAVMQHDERVAIDFVNRVLAKRDLLGGDGSPHVRLLQQLKRNLQKIAPGSSVFDAVFADLPRFGV
jgi:hypothetical protein